ncbi:hypothetical protein [Streptomyces sp. NBC_00986]|uniref:hypothetical protein n=1 Tax=Streptomyces sp. NBC_00986 TaxID=2903702 RepID=UPI00386C6FBE|nr:hypothetical protein OG504_25020 [Streptomyces sp. NBC_00986]
MGAFFAAATGFPTVVFTAALTVVVLFWLLVALGAADARGHAHVHLNSRAHGDGWGLGGVPVTLAFSLFTAVGWLISYCANVLFVPSGPVGVLVGAVVLTVTVYVSWRATKLLVRPLHRLFPDEHGPSRLDFVGLTCTIRTGRVDAGFGQAEVRSADGSAAVVQVRQTGNDALAGGSTGLLYAYDETGEFFWVAPYDSALDPRTGPGTTG